MNNETDILKIVGEDILRTLGEEKSKKLSSESLKLEIKVSDLFIFKAVKKLERRGLIQSQGDYILLTKKGRDNAKNILRKHLIIENYFKRTKNEQEAHEIAHILEHYVSEEVIKNVKELSTYKGKGIPLLELKLPRELLIADITIPNYELFERIISMGIFPGEKIKIVNEIPNGIIVEIKNKKFALDKDIAKEIKVLEYEKS